MLLPVMLNALALVDATVPAAVVIARRLNFIVGGGGDYSYVFEFMASIKSTSFQRVNGMIFEFE